MTDTKENTVSVRIYEHTQEEMFAEQVRRKRAGLEKPTFAELIDELWRQRDSFRADASLPFDPVHLPLVQTFLKLYFGDEVDEVHEGVREALRALVKEEYTQSRRSGLKKAR